MNTRPFRLDAIFGRFLQNFIILKEKLLNAGEKCYVATVMSLKKRINKLELKKTRTGKKQRN